MRQPPLQERGFRVAERTVHPPEEHQVAQHQRGAQTQLGEHAVEATLGLRRMLGAHQCRTGPLAADGEACRSRMLIRSSGAAAPMTAVLGIRPTPTLQAP